MMVPDSMAYKLVRELSSDEERLYFIGNHLVDYDSKIVSYILALDSDSSKFECLPLLTNEYYISLVIDSMSSDDAIARAIMELPETFSLSFIKHKISGFSLASKVFSENDVLYEDGYENARERFKIDDFDGSSLPSDMTFGIELEVIGGNSRRMRYFNIKPFGTWNNVNDDSLAPNSVEVTSPILHYTSKDMSELRAVCSYLKSNGSYTDGSCAGHIHIGLNSFKSPQALYNFYSIFSLMEPILVLISNRAGELPREGLGMFSELYQGFFEFLRKENVIEFNDINDTISQLYFELQTGHKYWTVNIGNKFNRLHPKDTMEFRIPNGSLDPDVIIHNMKLFGRLIMISNLIDKDHIEDVIDQLKTGSYDDIIIYFLKLVFDDLDDREYFYERWIDNYDLMLRNKDKCKFFFISEEAKRELYF